MNARLVRVGTLAVLLSLVRPVWAEEVSFTLLHLNDVYEIVPPREGELGGLARVASLRQQLSQERGPNCPVFTLLSGDCLSPSVMGFARIVKGGRLTDERLAGRQMVKVLNAMGLQYATFGNHEFDWRADEFLARLPECDFRWFSSNAVDRNPAAAWNVPHEVILTIPRRSGCGSLRVGLLGLTLDFKTDPTKPDYVKLLDPIGAARQQVSRLKAAACDVIVAVTHLKVGEDRHLSVRVPGIHLILGGHEHQRNYVPQPPGRAIPPIAKADANARTVYIHDFLYDTERGVLKVRSSLRFVDDRFDFDPHTAEVVDAWKARAFDGLRQEATEDTKSAKYGVVRALRSAGKLPAALTNDALEAPILNVGEQLEGRETFVRTTATNLTRLVTRVMRERAGADAQLAILNSGSIRIDDVIPKSGISVYDLFRILPFDVTVHRVDMKGRLLERLLTAGRSQAVREEGSFLQVDGYDFDRPGVIGLQGPIEDDTTYRVAIGNYLMLGGEMDLRDVLPARSLDDLRALPADADMRLAKGSDPFDLLTAVAEELTRLDRTGKTPEQLATVPKIEPSQTPLELLTEEMRQTEEAPQSATFAVPKLPRCDEEPRPAPSPNALDDLRGQVERVAQSLDRHEAQAVARDRKQSTEAISARETQERKPAIKEGGGQEKMEWWTVLAIFTAAGFIGGSLSTLQLADLSRLFSIPYQNFATRQFAVDAILAILYNALGGIGGAYAALFIMILDHKVHETLNETDKLTFAVTGVVAGFLGLQLLKLAGAAVIRAANAAVGEEVRGVAREIRQTVENVQQRVTADTQRLSENVDLRLKKMADLLEAIAQGRRVQNEEIDRNDLQKLIARLETGLESFPNIREGFIVLGHLYAKKADDLDKGIAVLERGLKALEASAAANPIDIADTHYILACYYCLKYDRTTAPALRKSLRAKVMEHLREAIKYPGNRAEAKEDADFQALRDTKEFQKLISDTEGTEPPADTSA